MSKFEYWVTFKNVESGVPFGTLTLPAPIGVTVAENIVYNIVRYNSSIELFHDDSTTGIRVDGTNTYTDHNNRRVTISCLCNVWNEVEIKVTIEE